MLLSSAEMNSVKSDELRDFLRRRQVPFEEKAIQYGIQIRCGSGEVFSVFDKGGVSIGGRKTELAELVRTWKDSGTLPGKAVAEGGDARAAAPLATGPDRRIFIVHGHDIHARDTLELLLRRMGLEPIVLQNLPAAGDTIIEKLERYFGEHGKVGFACVILTPDDEGHRAGVPQEQKYRARQNVILELGMVLSRLGRRRVAILHKQSVELPSDISGLLYIPFNERLEEIKTRIFQELKTAGYNPKTDAL